jgi:hypothetical protein
LDEVKTWQALCLSLNIDPEDDDLDLRDLATMHREFRRRQGRLLLALSDREFFTPGTLGTSDPLESSLRLAEFAAWCITANPTLGYLPTPLFQIGEPLAIERQERVRKAAGRYTLEEAAEHLSGVGESYDAMLARLKESAGKEPGTKGALPMRNPGREASIVYGDGPGRISRVREFYEHAYWDDLNHWLEENDRRIKYRFPNPARTSEDGRGFTMSAAQTSEPGSATAEVAPSRIVRHSTKTSRRDCLDPAIELAQRECKDPSDTAEVWARLQVLAQSEHPPLLAVTPQGLKYTKDGSTPAYFTRNALDKRLHREKRIGRRDRP